jgi:iron-sulfur cluster insertion protein
MSAVLSYTPAALKVTDTAVNKVKALKAEEHNDALCLRVYVTGGGCSGFQYGFSFDDSVAEDDTVIEKNGVKVLLDPLSYPYLAGSEVNYEEGLMGSRFVIQNPNAKTTCGCGSSFSV